MIYSNATIDILKPNSFEKLPQTVNFLRGKTIVPLIIYLKDNLGKVIGGLNASTCSSTAYTESIWFTDTCLPSLHIGKLIQKMESEVSQRGCTQVFINKPIKDLMHIYSSMGYNVVQATNIDRILSKKFKESTSLRSG
jgi:hypothetical protein